jgi:voltage-gated potassium channel
MRNNTHYAWKFKLIYAAIQKRALHSAIKIYSLSTIILFIVSWFVMTKYESTSIPDFQTFVYWFITTISTVGYGDISPATLPGRAITICVMIMGIGLFSILAGTVITIIISLKEKILKGLFKIVKENHILILGYHPQKTQRMVDEILADTKRTNRAIILVTDQVEKNPIPTIIDFVHGDITNESTLNKASADHASHVIISAKDDNETLMACIVITKTAKNAHIVAYINNPKYIPHLKDVNKNIVVVASNSVETMVREMQDPGVSGLISDLLTTRKSQTCFRIILDAEIPETTFGKVAGALKEKKEITLLGIWSDEEEEALENPPSITPVVTGSILYVINQHRPVINWEEII